MLTLDKIYHAAFVLKDVARKTDLIEAPKLSKDCQLYLKTENLQATGSFKVRGAYYKISQLSEEESAKGVIACSAGNHAQGVALAATRRGIKSIVCMPDGAPIMKVENTKNLGAEVCLVPGTYDDAHDKAVELQEETGMTFIHPYDDEQVIAGQGTIGLEILDQLPEDQRLVIGMFYYEEMSVKDIAFTLGVSDNTVKSRLSYGRKKVKELVLDLEKKGTKLYTVAPFTFFLYLLRRLESAPADPAEMGVLQSVMDACIEPAQSAGSWNTTGTAARAGAKAAGAAGKTAARHLSMKVAAIVLTGAVGAGGVYGVVKNADKLPFIHEQTSESENESSEEQKPVEAEPTKEPEETAEVTETPEPTESPEEKTETSEETKTDENTEETQTESETDENTEETQPESEPDNEQEQTAEDTVDYSNYPEYPMYKETFESMASNLEFSGLNRSIVEIALYDID